MIFLPTPSGISINGLLKRYYDVFNETLGFGEYASSKKFVESRIL